MLLMDFFESGYFVQLIKYGCELVGLCVGGVCVLLKVLDEVGKVVLVEIVVRFKGEVVWIVEGGCYD